MSVAVQTVPASLTYFTPPSDGSKPILYVPPPGAEFTKKNYESAKFTFNIENVRGKERDYKLDESGFEFHNAPSSLHPDDFDDETKIKEVYYKEVEETIKRLTGASKVVIFDHTLRNNDPNRPEAHKLRRTVADGVHVDQTPEAAAKRVTRHLPADEAAQRLKGRYQIINFWRPIRHEAYDKPLTVCDFRSVDFKKDLVPTTLRYPDFDGETFSVAHSPNHRWKYLKGMTPDEIILIKCADSVVNGSVSVCTPHTAFEDSSKPAETKFRESLEVRTLVFYD